MEGQRKEKRELTETEKLVVAARKRFNKAHHDLMEATYNHIVASTTTKKKKPKTKEEPSGPFSCEGDVVSGTPCDQGKNAVPAKSLTRHNGKTHQTCVSCKKKIKAARVLNK